MKLITSKSSLCAIAALFVSLSNWIPAQDKEKAADPLAGKEVIHLSCIGDSITQGVGADGQTCYAAVIGRALGKKWDVKNLGVSGATMLRKGDKPFNSLPQYKWALENKPDVVTIALGTNDTKPQNWAHKAEFEADYKLMIEELRKANSNVIIYCCLPPPTIGVKWGINEAIIKDEVVPLVKKIAEETKCKVIDLYASLDGKPGCIPDAVHPNAEGHKHMAAAFYQALTGSPIPEAAPK